MQGGCDASNQQCHSRMPLKLSRAGGVLIKELGRSTNTMRYRHNRLDNRLLVYCITHAYITTCWMPHWSSNQMQYRKSKPSSFISSNQSYMTSRVKSMTFASTFRPAWYEVYDWSYSSSSSSFSVSLSSLMGLPKDVG